MESNVRLRRACRSCGAILEDALSECWFCHRHLGYDDIVRAEMRPRAKHQPESPLELEAEDDLEQQTKPQDTTPESQVAIPGFTTSWEDVYEIGRFVTGVIAFALSWIYGIATFGWFLGVGLGWIPALVIASIVGVLWPLIAFVAAVAAVVVVFMIYAAGR